MKKLGLVGGMGPQSTVPYYLNIVYGLREKIAPDFFPNLTIESLNVFEILRLIGAGEYEKVLSLFLYALENLKKSGCEIAALTANTAHIIYDELVERSPLPLVSIIESTCAEAKLRGYRKPVLLGTNFTMERDFYKKPFIREGIDIVIPNPEERKLIDNKIVSELEMGIIKDSTRQEFITIINRLKSEEQADAIILGCTELPLILSDNTSPLPCLDTVKIHSSALIDASLES